MRQLALLLCLRLLGRAIGGAPIAVVPPSLRLDGVPIGQQPVPYAIQLPPVQAQYAPASTNVDFSPDFNPLLLNGVRGGGGLKVRLNRRMFQYVSDLMVDLLTNEIKRARIPPISQCISNPIQGCIQVYNLYVSRFRCPQRIAIYPAPPNKVVVAIQNLDVGVTGNLGGQINIILPLALTGIVHVNVYQVSVIVELVIIRTATCSPCIRVAGCTTTVGYVDVYIENGGLIGQITNSQFRSQVSEMVRNMIPSGICAQLPAIIDEKLNPQLGKLPQSVALTQIASLIGGSFGLGGGGSVPSAPYSGPMILPPPPSIPQPPLHISPPQPIPPYHPPLPQPQLLPPPPSAPLPPPIPAPSSVPAPPPPDYQPAADNKLPPTRKILHSGKLRPETAKGFRQKVLRSMSRDGHAVRVKVRNPPQSRGVAQRFGSAIMHDPYAPHPRSARSPRRGNLSRIQGSANTAIGPFNNNNNGGGGGGVVFSDGRACSNCPSAAPASPFAGVTEILQYFDVSKLSDMLLSLQLIQTYATYDDFTIELSGEFAPCGGCTPFGPFESYFPSCGQQQSCGGQMIEILLTDFTFNSLFYHAHKKGFLSARLGPETPKLGELLKTTCSEEPEGGGLEDHGVQLDDNGAFHKVKRRRLRLKRQPDARQFDAKQSDARQPDARQPDARQPDVEDHGVQLNNNGTFRKVKRRRLRLKRQPDASGLTDLGICLGDILPNVRDKFPNRNIAIQIHTARAPSVILSAINGGTAYLDADADADIYIDGTNQQVGTINIAGQLEVTLRTSGQMISGKARITHLRLVDRGHQLGLPQEALDNLGNLGKELLQKVLNDLLSRGIPISLPSTGLPIEIIGPHVQIVEHAIHIATDITISPTLLTTLTNSGASCRQ